LAICQENVKTCKFTFHEFIPNSQSEFDDVILSIKKSPDFDQDIEDIPFFLMNKSYISSSEADISKKVLIFFNLI